MVVSQDTLARLYKVQGKVAEAEALYRQRLTFEEQSERPDDLFIAYALIDLASLYRDQGRYGQAETLYKRALTLTEEAFKSSNPGSGAFMVLQSYAVLLRRTNRHEAAIELEARVQAMLYSPNLSAWRQQQYAQEPTRLSGATLQSVQQLLAALGYAPGTPDGVYSPQTHAAVKAFQRETGLPMYYNPHKLPPAFLEYLKARVVDMRGVRPASGQR
jgi:tetratricopeptide (TPR) repeat protein